MKFELIVDDKPAKIQQKMHSVIISKPFSTNDMLQVSAYNLISKKTGKKMHRLAPSLKYENYVKQVDKELQEQGFKPRLCKDLPKYPVFIHVTYHVPKTLKGLPSQIRKDVGNIEKSINDIFQGKTKRGYGYFFADDKQIIGILCLLGKSVPKGKMIVDIYKVKIDEKICD